LDEIGEMNGNLQAKLLRVLQEWEVDRVGGRGPVPVDVRLVATTNADLAQCVRSGKFREDLYFRLNVIPLSLPPLRERPDDIPLLARHFLTRCAQTHGKPVRDFTPRAMDQLRSQGWRGNVRELKNVVERAVLLASEPVLDAEDLWLEGLEEASSWSPAGMMEGSVKDVERGLILRTLEKEGWNRTRASARLGISIRTLRNKLQEYRREGFLSASEA
jgi:two-component system response regulator FlrC